MKLDESMAELIYDMECLIGSKCYNPNSCYGRKSEDGHSYRYPVYIRMDKDDEEMTKFNDIIYDVPPSQVETMIYQFGSNQIFIGYGLIDILNMLEKRYNIDFNELEEKRENKDDFLF